MVTVLDEVPCSVCGRIRKASEMPDGICSDACRKIEAGKIRTRIASLDTMILNGAYNQEMIKGQISIYNRMLEILAYQEGVCT